MPIHFTKTFIIGKLRTAHEFPVWKGSRMQELIKDFTPLITSGKLRVQQRDAQDQIGYLLSLLNTHNLITTGGVKLYMDKKGYEQIDIGLDEEDVIPGNVQIATFLGTTLSKIAGEAFDSEEPLREIADLLYRFNPDDKASQEALEEGWMKNQELIQDIIYLYSEYLYRVFMQDPFADSEEAV